MLAWALLLAAMGVQESTSAQVDQLADQLKLLSPDATGEEFLKRPAMSRLMSLGPAAVPALKKRFLTDDDWRIKASVGFVLIIMVQNRDGEIRSRWKSLLEDPNPMVRATMASVADQFCTSCVFTAPALKADAQAVFDRLKLWATLNWMAPEDLKALVANALTIIEAGNPYVDPPEWEMQPGMRSKEGNIARLRSVGVRVVKPEVSMAWLAINRVTDTKGAHAALPLIMQGVESDDGSDPARLGLKLRIASLALTHRGGINPPCYDSGCALHSENQGRLVKVCEKWAWKTSDPNAQYGILWVVRSVGGWKGYDLRERMAKEHPDAQVRELAGSDLNGHYNKLLDKYGKRDQEGSTEKGR